MSLPSASSLQRAALCAGSTVLPQVRTLPNESMDRGTNTHKYLEHIGQGMRQAVALFLVPEGDREFCAGIDLTQVPCLDYNTYRQELGLAWDWATGQGRSFAVEGRNYVDILPTEFFGTSDVVGIFDDRVEIWDYKIGFGGKLISPDQNLQLRFYALAAARAFGKPRANVGLVKVNEEGEVSIIGPHALDAEDLDSIATELKSLAAGIERAERQMTERGVPDVTEGDHCAWCPAQLHCPARMGLVKKVFALDVDTVVRTLDKKEKGDAYVKALAILDVAERIKKAVRDSVRAEGELALPNGNTLKVKMRKSRVLDSDNNRVVDAIAAKFGPDIAKDVVWRSLDISQTAIKSALQEHARANGVPLAPLWREAEAALFDAEVMTETTVEVVSEESPKAVKTKEE